MKELQHEGDWACFAAESFQFEVPSIETLIASIIDFPDCLKNDRRSLVMRGELFGKQVIAKQPRDKNRRKWAQFLSIFRAAEARHTFNSLLAFSDLGIPSVKPVCLLEKREGRRVVDSWLIYEYKEGQACDAESLPEVVGLLQRLHRHGFCHQDPNFGNFLIGPDDEMFLIDCKGNRKQGNLAVYYDFMLLSLRNEGVSAEQVEALIEINRFSPGYQLARLYKGYIATRTSLKQGLKRRKSKTEIQ